MCVWLCVLCVCGLYWKWRRVCICVYGHVHVYGYVYAVASRCCKCNRSMARYFCAVCIATTFLPFFFLCSIMTVVFTSQVNSSMMSQPVKYFIVLRAVGASRPNNFPLSMYDMIDR